MLIYLPIAPDISDVKAPSILISIYFDYFRIDFSTLRFTAGKMTLILIFDHVIRKVFFQ